MMMDTLRRIVTAGLATAGLVVLAACSDDVAGPGTGQLSGAEAAAISDFFVSQAFSGWDFSGVSASRTDGGAALQAGTPVTIDYSVSIESECPEGGSLTVSVDIAGTIDDETGSGDLSLEAVTSASACGIVAEGVGFTVDTNPDLTLTGDFAFANGELVGESTFTYTGSVSWVSEDGRSGTCTYDVSVSVSESGTSAASGTVCGTSV